MLRILDFVTGELGPTRTYGRRSFVWIPADRSHPTWDGRLGNLTLKMQHARGGVGRRIELDTYAIEEVPQKPGFPGRVFLLLNLTDESQSDVYETVIGPADVCSCTAGRVGHFECKHAAAVRHLIEQGELDDLDDANAPQGVGPDAGAGRAVERPGRVAGPAAGGKVPGGADQPGLTAADVASGRRLTDPF